MEPLIAEVGHWVTGKRRPLGTHRNRGLEIVAVTGGQATWHVEGTPYVVPPGSVFFTWPWEAHGGLGDAQPGLELSFVVIRLARNYRQAPRRFDWHDELGLKPGPARSIRRSLISSTSRSFVLSPTMLWLVRAIVDNWQSVDRHRHAMCAGLAKAAVVELVRAVEQGATARRQADAGGRIDQLLKRIEATCHEPWTVDSMAMSCQLRRSRLTELVKKRTGDPPGQLLNRYRIARARTLLATTDRTITDIAGACGFASSQYFCRVFRDFTGTTPSNDRNKHR